MASKSRTAAGSMSIHDKSDSNSVAEIVDESDLEWQQLVELEQTKNESPDEWEDRRRFEGSEYVFPHSIEKLGIVVTDDLLVTRTHGHARQKGMLSGQRIFAINGSRVRSEQEMAIQVRVRQARVSKKSVVVSSITTSHHRS